jgi:chemotaxis protein histidine kinase CheA
LKDYYARRLQIVQEGMDAELAVAQKEVTAAQNAARYAQSPNEKAQSAARITTAQNRVALLKQQEREQLLQLNEQEEAEAQNHANKMAEIDLQAQEKVILQRLKQQETIAQAEVAMGQRSKSQAVNTEIATENARYVAQMDYYQKVSALQGLSQEKLEQLKAQEEELEQQHQEKLLQIVSKGAEEQAKPQQQMLQQVEGDFSSFFANVISGTQTFKQAAISLYMGLGRQITEVMTKRFVNDLLGGANAPNAGAGGIGGIGGILQKGIGYLFGTEQGGGPQTIAAQMVTAQNTTAMQAAQVTVASMTVASMVGAGGTGGGGLAGLLGGLGGGSMGGDFGFTATGVAASSAAVGDGLLAQTASTGGSASALMGLSGGFAAYAKGTNYVPETGLAMLHRGEAVVPAAYNNSRTNMSARIQNNFYLPQHYDMRTQGQVAAAAGGAISAALKRNR